MKEILVTRGLFEAGLIKPGMRVITRFSDDDAVYTGNVISLVNEDVNIRYDDGDMDSLYIPGFCVDIEEEAKATPRLYILEDEPESDGPAEALYMLMDMASRRILLNGVVLGDIQAYALAEYRELGTTDHLVAVAVADVKPVKLGLVL